MPSLNQLWDATRMGLLIELEKCHNLSEAASKVGITQPTASEHLRLLSVAAGEPVAERHGRGLRLTDAGRVLAAHASQALACLAAGEATLAERSGVVAGDLRLGASSVPGIYLVAEALGRFVERYPAVDTQFTVNPTHTVVEWLLAGRLQMAVTCSAIEDERIVSQQIANDEIVGIASPDLLNVSASGRVRAGDLAGMRLLLQEWGAKTRDYALEVLPKHGVTWGESWELGSIDAVKRAARSGLGIGFLSIHTLAEERLRGELVVFHVDDVPAMLGHVLLLRRAHTAVSPAERQFGMMLTDHMSRNGSVQSTNPLGEQSLLGTSSTSRGST